MQRTQQGGCSWCEAVTLIQHTEELREDTHCAGAGKIPDSIHLGEKRGDACCVHPVPEEGDGGDTENSLLQVDNEAVGIQAAKDGEEMSLMLIQGGGG